MNISLESNTNKAQYLGMPRLTLIILGLALLNVGCKKDDGSASVSTARGSCNYGATTLYSGAVVAGEGPQSVAIASSFTNADKVDVYLCRNVDCTVSPLPAAACNTLTLTQQTTTPCYATGYGLMISFSPRTIAIQKAGVSQCSSAAVCGVTFDGAGHAIPPAGPNDIPAYSTYLISEQICI